MSCEVDTTIQLDEERTDINEVEGEMCHLSDPRRRSLGQPSVEGSGAKRRTLNGLGGQPSLGPGFWSDTDPNKANRPPGMKSQ